MGDLHLVDIQHVVNMFSAQTNVLCHFQQTIYVTSSKPFMPALKLSHLQDESWTKACF